jgi:cell division protein FtsI (penicillin-binding protein 3)
VRVVDETLRYLGVPPKAGPADSKGAAPVVAAKPAPGPGPDQDDQERDSELPADADEDPAEPGLLQPEGVSGDMVMIPDFRGMSVKRALDVARSARIAVDIEGSGRAVEQFPAPGPAPWPGECRIVFAPGYGVKEARAPSSARAATASGTL